MNRSLALAAITVVVLLMARSAAASVVLAKPGGDVHVSDVRMAYATNASRTVTWEQLVLDESRGDLAWLVPVPRGGFIELADDHWFEALDQSTAAVIVPHKSVCASPVRENTTGPRAPMFRATTGHAQLAPSAAIDRLVSLGYEVSPATRASILSLDALNEDVAILLLPAGARVPTRVVRVVGPVGRVLPLSMLPSTGALPRMTTYVFGDGRARFARLPAMEVDAAKLTWTVGTSNYGDLLDSAIIDAAPGVAITFAAADGVFREQPAGPAGGVIPSLSRSYFGTADTCVARTAGLGPSSKIVSPTCPKGTPLIPGAKLPECVVPTSEQLPSSDLACGGLDDLAVAVSGTSPSRVVLSRMEGVATPTLRNVPIEFYALGSILSYREAMLGSCSGETTTPPGTNPGTGNPTTPGSDPSTGSSGGDPSSSSSSSTSDGCGPTAAVFADACTRSSSSDSGGCSGDSSSDSDGCGGDSSSDSGGCSSDSSSSGGCSGASDSSDDGCSSSSSSSSSSCSGAASSADDGCRAARVRPRVRFSAGVYVIIALLAIGRRFGRRRWYHPASERPCPEKTSTDAPAHE